MTWVLTHMSEELALNSALHSVLAFGHFGLVGSAFVLLLVAEVVAYAFCQVYRADGETADEIDHAVAEHRRDGRRI